MWGWQQSAGSKLRGGVRAAAGGGAPDITAPIVASVVYAAGPPTTITFNVNEACTLYALRNASAAPLTGAAIQAGAEVTQAIAAGDGYISWDDSGWAAGTWYLHPAFRDAAGNFTTIAPIAHVIAAAFVSNAVLFDGTNDWLSAAGMATPVASTGGTFAMGFRIPSPWPAGSAYNINFRKAGSSSRFSVRLNRNSDGVTLSSGRLSLSVFNDAGSADGYYVLGDFAVTADQWCSFVVTYDSTQAVAADRWKAKIAHGAGAFTTPATAFSPALPLNMIVGATADCVIGAETLGGLYKSPAWDLSYVYYAPGQIANLADTPTLEKFRASSSGRGADGSGPTGSQPFIFLQGATATFETNLGTGGGFTENGALTTSAGPLP